MKGTYRIIQFPFSSAELMERRLDAAVKELEKGVDNGDWQFSHKVEVVSHHIESPDPAGVKCCTVIVKVSSEVF